MSKVGIIVPCYNQAQYLEEAIRSVQAQTYTDWECIIVNDGSADDTEKVARQLCREDQRISYLHKENGGLSSARNAGIAASKAEFILPLDADDKIHPHYLQDAMRIFENQPGLSLVYADAEYFDARTGQWLLPEFNYEVLLTKNLVYCSAVFRRSDWEAVGGYDEGLRSGWEDWEFWIRLLHGSKQVYKIPRVRFYYRQKQVSMIHNLLNDDEKCRKAQHYIFNKHQKIYEEQFGSIIRNLEIVTKLKQENDRIKNSRAYKFSTQLVTLVSPIRSLINRIKVSH